MILELRQYTCRPGQRDVLIDLFERELIPPQRAAGMQVLGQFCDADDPDRFVWLRAFADMPARLQASQAFYDSALWHAKRSATNATLVDSSNVLLLRPVGPDPDLTPARETPLAASLVASILLLETPVDDAFRDGFAADVAPALAPLGCFESETGANTWTRHPVRTGEHAFVCLARRGACGSGGSAISLPPALAQRLAHPPQHVHLVPTLRSPLR